jgi:hypothetical protein
VSEGWLANRSVSRASRPAFAAVPLRRATFEPPVTLSATVGFKTTAITQRMYAFKYFQACRWTGSSSCLPPFSCSRSNQWRPRLIVVAESIATTADTRAQLYIIAASRARSRGPERYILQRVLNASEAVRDGAGDQRRDSDHHDHRQVTKLGLPIVAHELAPGHFITFLRRNPLLDAL